MKFSAVIFLLSAIWLSEAVKTPDVFCKVPENLTPFQATSRTEYGYNSEVAFKCKEENSYLNYHGEFVDSFNSKCSSDKRWTNLQNAKCFTAPSNVSLEGSMP